MRLYGKKFIKKYMDGRINLRKGTADGILWSVDHIARIARVRIQGSSEDIIAHYPRNWRDIPYWLKPRNAVRIVWREGHRGYIEISGEGRAIPTPMEGPTYPEISPLADHWLYGGKLIPTSPESLNLIATGGAYVVDGETYFFNPSLIGGDEIIMDDPAPMTMGDGEVMAMGTGQYTVTIDAAPACYRYRYDAFVVGIDGEVDYLKGVQSATEPAKPSIPGEHILIGDYIFVKPNVTQIFIEDIGAEWSEALITYVTVSWDNWWNNETGNDGDDPPVCRMSWTIFDQYDCNTQVSGSSLNVKITSDSSIGQISLSATGPWSDEINTTGKSGRVYQKITALDNSGYGMFMIIVEVTYGTRVALGAGIFHEQLYIPV